MAKSHIIRNLHVDLANLRHRFDSIKNEIKEGQAEFSETLNHQRLFETRAKAAGFLAALEAVNTNHNSAPFKELIESFWRELAKMAE